MQISFTKYRFYRECPWKYKLAFVDQRQISLSAKSSYGLSLHRALEHWLQGGDLSLESLRASLRSRWLTSGYVDEDEESRYFAKAERTVSRFYGEEESRRARTVCVEKEFFFATGSHEARGKIDRIDQGPDGAYELIDYKTGPGVPTVEQVAKDKQMKFYALGAQRGLQLPAPETLTVDCVTVGARVSAPYDPSGEDALDADIRAAASGIEAAAFPPDTSYCPRCDFRKDCRYSAAK